MPPTDAIWIKSAPPKIERVPWVTDRASAFEAYWSASTAREQQAAYHEILLFGGFDGFAPGPIRGYIARMLRVAALKVSGIGGDSAIKALRERFNAFP